MKQRSHKKIEKNLVTKHAALMSMGSLLSRLLGYVRDLVLYALFPHFTRDAFLVAFQLPNIFRRIFGEGALAFSFIPVYVETKEKKEKQAQQLANALMSLLWTVTSIICVFGIIFMDQLLPIVVRGDGYEQIAGKVELTILLARIIFVYLFFVTSYAYYMSILNTLGEFFIPAFAPALFNGALIVASLWAKTSQNPTYLAWGVVVGGILQMGIVFWSLERKSKRPRWTFKWKVPGLFLVLKKMIPGVIGIGVLQLMSFVNVYFASYLPQGTHSFLYLGQRILDLPQSLISVSLSVALLPTLSRLQGTGRGKEMLSLLSHHIKLLMFLTLPCAVGLYILAEPIVVTLFFRGEFHSTDAKITSSVIKIFSLLLLIGSLNKVMITVLYSIKNTWYPALVSLLCLLIHVGIAQWTIVEYGIQGLVGSMVFCGFCNALGVFIGVRFFIGNFQLGQILWSQWKTGVAAGGMGLAVFLLYDTYTKIYGSSYETPLDWGLFLVILLGAGLYFYLAHLLKSQSCEEVTHLFWKRIKKSFSQKP